MTTRLLHVPTDPPLDVALDVSHLVKRYNNRPVVNELSFTAPHAAITAVLGPNGAGKTTTIECCEGLRRGDAGHITVLGRQVGDPVLREQVGVMLQDGGLPTGVRAVEMLHHVAAMYSHPRSVDELIERLGLGSFAGTTVRRLSGGQRQRLALAAAVVGRPQLVFLDEPSAGMDPQSRHAVWDLVTELRAEGVSFVLTTHMMDEAAALADQVIIVDHGRVIAQGTVAALTGHVETDISGAHSPLSTIRWTAGTDLPIADLASRLQPADAWQLTSPSPGHYSAVGPTTPEAVATVSRWCAEQNTLITELTVDHRSLEDVFLDLTGRSLR